MQANSQINEYIMNLEGITRDHLTRIYAIISEILPEAEQGISWGMPTFKFGKYNAFHFAAYKKHVSLFASSYATEHFAEALQTYKTSKGGAIQFQNKDPLPEDLIREIVSWRKQFMVEHPEMG